MIKIAIHSVPRSGSSWIGQIFNSSPHVNYKFQPLFSYAFKDYLDEYSSKEKIDEFFEKIAESDNEFLLQKDKVEKGIYPKFKKAKNYTHIVYKEVRYHHILENMLTVNDEIIVVGLVRNPYAVVNSFLKAPREFRKDFGWNPLDEWQYANKKNLGRKEEFYGYEKWKEVFFLFRRLKRKYPKRFYLLFYKNLLNNTVLEIESLFKFCKIEMTEQTYEFINKSRMLTQADAYSVYKRKNNDDNWKRELHSEIIKKITSDLKKIGLYEYIKENL